MVRVVHFYLPERDFVPLSEERKEGEIPLSTEEPRKCRVSLLYSEISQEEALNKN